jgi:hypothetical protein
MSKLAPMIAYRALSPTGKKRGENDPRDVGFDEAELLIYRRLDRGIPMRESACAPKGTMSSFRVRRV